MKKSINNKILFGIIAVTVVIIIVGIVIFVIPTREENENTNENKGVAAEIPDGEMFDYQEANFISVGNYKGVAVEVKPDEEDIDLELSSVLDDMKINKNNKKIKKGDYAYIDYTASEKGIDLEDMQEDDVLLLIGKYKFFEAFEDALIGKEAGETYSVPLKFADDYKDASLAGKTVDFRVKIKAKFDDAYAREVSKGKYKSVAEYRKMLREKLQKDNMENMGELAWDALMEKCQINQYPKALVKEEVKNLKKQYAGFAEVSGISYEELMESLMMDEASVEDTAQDVVRDRMVAKTMAKWENFTLDEKTCRKYLIQLMEYEKDDDDTLEHFYEDYREDYGNRPKDDILVAMAKDYVSKHATIK